MSSQSLKRILTDYKNYLWVYRFWYTIVFWSILSIFVTFEPFIFSKIIHIVENFYTTKVFDSYSFWQYLLIWAWYLFLSLVGTFYYRYKLAVVNVLNFYSHIFQTYAEKTLHISYNTYLSKKQGEIFKRFDAGTDNIFWFMMEFYNDILKTFVWIFVVFIALFFIDWRMALAMSTMLPVLLLLWYYTNSVTAPKQRLLEDEYNVVFWNVSDSLTNMALVKTLTLENHLTKNIKNDFIDIISRQFSISRWWTYTSLTTALVIWVSRIIILWLGIYLIANWSLSLATLFLFYSLTWWIYFPLAGIFERMRNIQKQLVAIEKFYLEFDSFEYEKLDTKWKKLDEVKGKIEFKNVSFSYSEHKEVLKDISFTIEPWKKIALVWNTWAWKSTIVNLIFRLWEVGGGDIFIDGTNIKNIDKKDLRNHIGIVMQDNTLFNTSIRNNLLLANKKATEKDIIWALKNAKADFVLWLNKWLDTLIGERGLKLSWWEKQRINIARLLLKNPKIVILDEATSALDNTTEKEVQISLDTLMKWRTAIIIAHRLSTIKHADIIIVLENGEIVESGNYEELMWKQWKFYALANPDKLII